MSAIDLFCVPICTCSSLNFRHFLFDFLGKVEADNSLNYSSNRY